MLSGEVEVKVDDSSRRRKRPTKKTAGTSLPDSGAEREPSGFGHYLVSLKSPA